MEFSPETIDLLSSLEVRFRERNHPNIAARLPGSLNQRLQLSGMCESHDGLPAERRLENRADNSVRSVSAAP